MEPKIITIYVMGEETGGGRARVTFKISQCQPVQILGFDVCIYSSILRTSLWMRVTSVCHCAGYWLFLPLQGWVSLDVSSLAASICPSVIQTQMKKVFWRQSSCCSYLTHFRRTYLFMLAILLMCLFVPPILCSSLPSSCFLLWFCDAVEQTQALCSLDNSPPTELWFSTFPPFHQFFNVLF